MKAWSALLSLCSLLAIPTIAGAQTELWTLMGMGGGGILLQPTFNPHNRQELYLSSGKGVIFRSTDLGTTWSRFTREPYFESDVVSGVEFTNAPLVFYRLLASGGRASAAKTSDGGVTWDAPFNDPTNGDVHSLFADPNDARRLFLTDYSQLFVSRDGGLSFTLIDRNDAGYRVAGTFFDGETIYLGTNTGLHLSTDGGATWSLTAAGIPPGEAMLSFAGARRGGTTRFYCIAVASGDAGPLATPTTVGAFREVYTLEQGGSWKKVESLPSSFHPFFLSMARQEIDVAYIAGDNDAGTPAVYKTTDGGATWKEVFRTSGNATVATGWCGDGGDRGWSYAGYAAGFKVDPNDGARAVMTDLGLAHLTTDGGATWREIYTSPTDANPIGFPTPKGKTYRSNGLETSTSWGLAWADENTIIAGCSKIGAIRSEDRGASWSMSPAGPTMYSLLWHPSTGILYGGTSSIEDIYQISRLSDNPIDLGEGQVLFSGDKGRTWQVLHDFGHPVVGLALDPADPNRLYASVVHSREGGIYVSSDIQLGAASTWKRLASPPRTEGHPFNIHVLGDGSLVATYSARRSGSSLTSSSGVFLSTDGGSNWIDRSAPEMVNYTRDLVVDTHDPTENTWYVGVFGGSVLNVGGTYGGLYRTTDRGLTWLKLLDEQYISSFALSPVNRGEMYVALRGGLRYTDAVHLDKPTFDFVDSYPFMHPQRIFFDPYKPKDIWVTSDGDGIMRGSTSGSRLPDIPLQIAPAHGSVVAGTTVGLRWYAVPGATSYDVRVGPSQDLSKPQLSITDLHDSTAAFEARPGATYYWGVRARMDSSISFWSASWRFTVDAPADARETTGMVAGGASITAAPNPASSTLTFRVTLPRRAHATLRIVDALGAVVAVPFDGELEAGSRSIEVDASGLASGCYRYELLTDQGSMTGSVAIVR